MQINRTQKTSFGSIVKFENIADAKNPAYKTLAETLAKCGADNVQHNLKPSWEGWIIDHIQYKSEKLTFATLKNIDLSTNFEPKIKEIKNWIFGLK